MSAQLIRTTVQSSLHVQILKVVLAALATLDTLEMVETATVSVLYPTWLQVHFNILQIPMNAQPIYTTVQSRLHVQILMVVSAVAVTLGSLEMA